MVGQGGLAEAERWLERAGQTLRTEAERGSGMYLQYGRGLVGRARGRNEEALADIQAAERLAATLVTPHILATSTRADMLQALVGLGETGRAEAALAGLEEHERGGVEMGIALASLRLAPHHPPPHPPPPAPPPRASASRRSCPPSLARAP